VPVTFATGLCPDWNTKRERTRSETQQTVQVQVLSGGLEDSDVEAINPFGSPDNSSRVGEGNKHQAEASRKISSENANEQDLS